MKKVINNAGKNWSTEWLKSVTEAQAVELIQGDDANTTRKVWKIANGLSVPNYLESEEEDKPKKRPRKKQEPKKDNKPKQVD